MLPFCDDMFGNNQRKSEKPVTGWPKVQTLYEKYKKLKKRKDFPTLGTAAKEIRNKR
jgi:hypothetical protein